MNYGRYVFSQLLDYIPDREFRRLVVQYGGNRKVTRLRCWDQFLAMAFAQLTYRESLRDIVDCLNAIPQRLYHLGLQSFLSRSTLADANGQRDWRIYRDLAQRLIARARPLYAQEDLGVDLANTIYALDSTTIDLCLNLFPWARFRRTKAAVKLHTLLDVRGSIPTFIHLSEGKCADVRILDILPVEPGSIYVVDRGYLDFHRLYQLTRQGAWWVTRAKCHLRLKRFTSQPVDKASGLRCDQLVWLATQSYFDYPERLRRIRYFDEETGKSLVFLTNHLGLPALVIAKLYKLRWRVELFFKWIKQHLRIRSFYGTSDNAVLTQVWIAVCVYVMVSIIRKDLNIQANQTTMMHILSVSLFEKMPLPELFAKIAWPEFERRHDNQLLLFNL